MAIDDPNRRDAWEESYGRRENFVFWPSDEVVRFFARHLRRRSSLDQVVDVLPGAGGSRMLDLGCGIGRNLILGRELGLDMYGIDLSKSAIGVAREWFTRNGGTGENVVDGDIRQLPWSDGFFAHALSDSVLDSLSFDIAETGVAELARTLQPNGYFYCNLISGDDSSHDSNFSGEETVRSLHEQDTIQSYFNRAKIDALLGKWFNILSCTQVRVSNPDLGTYHSRWHVTALRR